MKLVSDIGAPAPASRDLVILVHGLTGAPGEMRYIGKKLSLNGLDIDIPMLAGHGRGYPEVMATGWTDWLDTLLAVYDDKALHYDRVHVAGICIGGLLGFMLAQRRAVASCTVYAPLFSFDGWAMRRHYALVPFTWPLMYLPFIRSHIVQESHPFGLKDDRMRELAAQSQDALIPGALDGMPYKSIADSYCLGQAVLAAAPRNVTPLTVVHAKEDEVCSPANAYRLCEAAGGTSRLVLLHDSYHMIHVDRERSKVVAATLETIRDQIPEAAHV